LQIVFLFLIVHTDSVKMFGTKISCFKFLVAVNISSEHTQKPCSLLKTAAAAAAADVAAPNDCCEVAYVLRYLHAREGFPARGHVR